MKEESAFSSNIIKFVAIIAMSVDHVTSTLFTGYNHQWYVLLLHLIGRLTAPIMCYYVVEGFYHTHDVKKYAIRLFAFAFVSHFAYNFAFGIPFIPFKTGVLNQTSILWPLALGVTALSVKHSTNPKLAGWKRTALITLLIILAFPSDWSSIAVLWILNLDDNDNRTNAKGMAFVFLFFVAFYAIVYCIFVDLIYGLLQFGVVLAVPIINLYNGKRGNWKGMKWFFYLYYPLHLVLCGILRLCLYGNVGTIVGGV